MTQEKDLPADGSEAREEPQAASAETRVETTAEAPDPAPPAAEPEPPLREETPQPARPSRIAGAGFWLALLDFLIIIGLAAAAYLGLQNLEHQRFGQQQDLTQLSQTVNRLDVARQGREQWFSDSDERSRETRREVAELLRQQAQLLARQEKSDQALARLANQIQGGKNAWQRAEIEHLLLVANTRLQLQRDLEGTRIALQLADSRLASLSNPAYFSVREKIAQELGQLEAVPRIDAQALALKLDSLTTQVDAMATRPVRVGQFDTELQFSGGPAESAWYTKLWISIQDAVSSLVSVRRDVDRREPLLPPEQGFYLRQNLRLQLESARLAALRLDTVNYRAALSQAENWLQRYFDSEQAACKAALQTIRTLQPMELKPALPDISGSLNALRMTELEA